MQQGTYVLLLALLVMLSSHFPTKLYVPLLFLIGVGTGLSTQIGLIQILSEQGLLKAGGAEVNGRCRPQCCSFAGNSHAFPLMMPKLSGRGVCNFHIVL